MNPRAPGSIGVLIVEDSPVVAELLRAVLSSDPAIRVLGMARDGHAAVETAMRLRPSVITMDVHMPHVDGFEATRRIMETCPAPIVIVSATVPADRAEGPLHAVAAGALAMVPCPHGPGHPLHADSARQLIETVKLMSEVKVVRRWPRSNGSAAALPVLPRKHRRVQAVALGASTGGPLVLQAILSRLPKNMPVPLLIVQHMSPGFVGGFTEWLAQSTGFPVQLATQGEALLAGHAYIAPDNMHMGVRPDGRLLLSNEAPENGVRPAVSYLFRSLVHTLGPGVVAVMLTGMGRDGVDEMKQLKDAGAVTIAQDEPSSVVFGMPGQAVEAGAVSHVLPPEGIASALAGLVDDNA